MNNYAVIIVFAVMAVLFLSGCVDRNEPEFCMMECTTCVCEHINETITIEEYENFHLSSFCRNSQLPEGYSYTVKHYCNETHCNISYDNCDNDCFMECT